jgi:hypothetical protein
MQEKTGALYLATFAAGLFFGSFYGYPDRNRWHTETKGDRWLVEVNWIDGIRRDCTRPVKKSAFRCKIIPIPEDELYLREIENEQRAEDAERSKP